MSNKPKKLTLNALNKHDSKMNGKKTIYVLDDQYAVNLHSNFRPTLIKQLAVEYMEYVNELNRKPEITSETIMAVPYLLYGLTAKFFTDLPIQYENVDELVEVTKKLLDLGIIEQLYTTGFEESEIEKLNKELGSIQQGLGQAIGEMAIKEALHEPDETENEDDSGVEENGE